MRFSIIKNGAGPEIVIFIAARKKFLPLIVSGEVASLPENSGLSAIII